MCKPASFVLIKNDCFWSAKSDSHYDIIEEHKLHTDGARGPNTVAVEISPPKGNLSLPLEQWIYKCDQDILPAWYEAGDGEKRARIALNEWAKQKLAGWKVKESFNPVHPLRLNPEKFSKRKLTLLLTQWASVWASVGKSVGKSAGKSVGESVWKSVWASVGAYIGGLFPNIKTWEYVEKLGSDPWRPLLTLWSAGYVPSFDGTTWRLHCGAEAKIVLAIKRR